MVRKGSSVRVRQRALRMPRSGGVFVLGGCSMGVEHVPNMSREWRTICIVANQLGSPTGHVFRVERRRGPCWYAKYRLPDGRQVKKKLGPARTGRGRPAAGYFTKRLAEDWLRTTLEEARRGTLPGM